MSCKVFKGAMVAMAVAVALTGCRTITGRTAGTYLDDAATTTKVKTALAALQVGTLARVDVDTLHGRVYLTGAAKTQENKEHIMNVARGAAEGKPVVDQLFVAGETAPAASPRTE